MTTFTGRARVRVRLGDLADDSPTVRTSVLDLARCPFCAETPAFCEGGHRAEAWEPLAEHLATGLSVIVFGAPRRRSGRGWKR